MATRWSARALARWIAAVALAGCATIWGPRMVEISPAQLQRALDRQLPVGRTLWGHLEIRLSAAQVSLRPDEQRLSLRLTLELNDLVAPRPHRATLSVSHGVRFEPADNTVRLTRARIDAIALDGDERALDQPLARWAVQAAEQFLDDRVLYTLTGDDLQALQRRGWRPGELHVGASGIVLTLLPVASGG